MKITDSKSVQTFISYSVYILSGFLIFSPIHKSQNIPLSLFCAAAVSLILLLLMLRIFSITNSIYTNIVFARALSICAALFSLFASLMLLTEIIKDTAYIANRGVSLLYYTAIAIAVLFVSFSLSIGGSKGIMRFYTLSIIPFALLLFTIFFSLFTTKGISVYRLYDSTALSAPIITGLRSGIFYTLDTSVFIFSFREQISTNKGTLPKKQMLLGYLISYTFIFIYNIFTHLIFGSLTFQISDADYALVKLIRGIDLTEIISAVRIISFLIKASLYIYLSSKCIYISFPKVKQNTVIILVYLLIPASFLLVSLFDKSLEYGAFQHLIYPVTAIMSILFTAVYFFTKKSE